MSDTVQPHRRQPTGLLCPWDSPGKSTGVGCHFLLQRMHACYVASVVSNSMWLYGQQPTRLLWPRDSLGKSAGGGYHFLLQLLTIRTYNLDGKWCPWSSYVSVSLPVWDLQYLKNVFFASGFKSHTSELLVNTDMEPQRGWILESPGPNITQRQYISNSRFFLLSQVP